MTNEEKDLLLKVLCAELQYGLMCDRFGGAREVVGINITDSKRNIIVSLSNGDYMPSEYCIEEIKPYLRPMESMTEEESDILCAIGQTKDFENIANWKYWASANEEFIDYLNKHHFDYRGLIPMSLALEAPEDMYNNN